MNDSNLTVAALLPAEMVIDPSQIGAGAATSAAPMGLTTFLHSKLKEGVASALDIDVLGLVAQAWAGTDELRKLAAPDKRSAAAPVHLFLAKHDVVCENVLKLTLEFAGMPAITDHLKLNLTAKFEGVGVTVERGCIVALDAGRGAAKAELLYSSTRLLGSTTDWVTLPPRYVLKRPIEIARERVTN